MSVEGRTLLLENVPVECTERILYDIFSPFGLVEDIDLEKTTVPNPSLPLDKQATSTCFIVFHSRDSALEACLHSQGKAINGRPLR
jgi:RNA recognition motif-containing protein